MIDIDDRDFLDVMYAGWAKTTGAEDTYWMPEEVAELFDGYRIVAVRQDESRETVAANLTEADAAFITAVHGCFADLVRRMHTALDEADRLDGYADERTGTIAELAIENDDLKEKVEQLETVIEKMDQELIQAKSDAEYWHVEASRGDWGRQV